MWIHTSQAYSIQQLLRYSWEASQSLLPLHDNPHIYLYGPHLELELTSFTIFSAAASLEYIVYIPSVSPCPPRVVQPVLYIKAPSRQLFRLLAPTIRADFLSVASFDICIQLVHASVTFGVIVAWLVRETIQLYGDWHACSLCRRAPGLEQWYFVGASLNFWSIKLWNLSLKLWSSFYRQQYYHRKVLLGY